MIDHNHATLSNPTSDRVRSVARLMTAKGRTRAQAFVIEGPQAVREARAVGAVTHLYLTPEAAERHPELLSIEPPVEYVRYVTDEVLAAMTDTKTPQGVIAVARTEPGSFGTILGRRPPLIAALSNARDPGNMGTIIRTADAAGAGAILASQGCVDIYNPKVVRSTTGSLFHVDIATGLDLTHALSRLSTAGYVVLAADTRGDDLDTFIDHGSSGVLSRPTVWLFGNEAWGLDDGDLACADYVVRVPIYGDAESLNLAQAAALCLYASARAQRHHLIS